MAINNKKIYIISLLITIVLFLSLLLLRDSFGNAREGAITARVQETYNNLNEMQMFMLMSEIYGDEMACLASKEKLKKLDKSLWDLGIKIDQYRVASEEFMKDPFYLEQKKVFNDNEIFYMMLLGRLNKHCDNKQEVVSFFYKNSKDCKKCDDQSFVLTDIKKDAKDDLSIFSYDADLNLTSINLLTQYYGINEFPCIIIKEKKYCGMQDKDFIVKEICNDNEISICNEN